MTKIFCRSNMLTNLLVQNIRKYSEGCKNKPEYECVQPRKLSSIEERELRLKSIQHPFLKKNDCHGKSSFWAKIFIFACIPAVLTAAIYAKYIAPEPKRPPYVDYPHLRIIRKPFPWRDGKKPLFYNPHFNALPGGYETESEDEDDI